MLKDALKMKGYQRDKVLVFLSQHAPSKIMGYPNLVQEICAYLGFEVEEVKTKEGKSHKAFMSYLYNLKKRLPTPKEIEEKEKDETSADEIKVVKVEEGGNVVEYLELKEKTEGEPGKQAEYQTQYRAIKKIHFSSPATKNTIQRLEKQSEAYYDMVKDYYFYMSGGNGETEEELVEVVKNGKVTVAKAIRFRYQFHSIAYGKAIQKMIKTALDSGELFLDRQILDDAQRTLRLLTSIEKQSLDLTNSLAEGGVNIQRELQGAILNDKAIVENGVVVLGEEQKQASQEEADKLAKDVIKHSEDPRFKDILQRMEKGQR